MSVLSIVQLKKGQHAFPGSCLRLPATPVSNDMFGSECLKSLVSDMFETLYSCPTGVGLAANQVGLLIQLCVVDLKRDGQNPLVLINPTYTPIGQDTVVSTEVCLSFPNISSTVNRHKKVRVHFYDIWGNEHEIEAEGFKSNVFQHEIDHLFGCPHIDKAISEDSISDYAGGNVRTAEKAMTKITSRGETK